MKLHWVFCGLALVTLASISSPDLAAQSRTESAAATDDTTQANAAFQSAGETGSASGNRWLLILCGLPGDEVYAERLLNAVQDLHRSAPSCLGIHEDRLHVLAGDPEMAEALSESVGTVGIATAESVAQLAKQVQGKIAADDSLWVFVLGHADLQGRASRWNVTDADPDQKTFAKWFQGIECREKVFWITTPLSGFYIRNLSDAGTVVITATEADLEISATEMPYVLSEIMSAAPDALAAGDRDEDGATSLADLYLAVCHQVAERYAAENLLQTEHAQIDDNGDRRGTELQQHYLPEELGGKPATDRTRSLTSLDGSRAAKILLPGLPVAKPAQETEGEEGSEPEGDAADETQDDSEAETPAEADTNNQPEGESVADEEAATSDVKDSGVAAGETPNGKAESTPVAGETNS